MVTKMQFPEPEYVGPTRMARWRESDLDRYDAACTGHPLPERRSAETERWLSAASVARRYDVHRASIWRWLQRQKQGAEAA